MRGAIRAAAGVVTALAALGLPAPQTVAGTGDDGHRRVEGRTLVSDALPEIAVRVAPEFEYVGRIDFRIRDVATGERYIFVDADESKAIRRMFIFQFEGFLPGKGTYKYDFTRAMNLRGYRFRHNTWAFSYAEAARSNPEGEAALTAAFLRDKGYKVADEQMMSRFVTVCDEERRHELILFYMERLADTGHRLGELYQNDRETPLWREISGRLKRRSLGRFDILSRREPPFPP